MYGKYSWERGEDDTQQASHENSTPDCKRAQAAFTQPGILLCYLPKARMTVRASPIEPPERTTAPASLVSLSLLALARRWGCDSRSWTILRRSAATRGLAYWMDMRPPSRPAGLETARERRATTSLKQRDESLAIVTGCEGV